MKPGALAIKVFAEGKRKRGEDAPESESMDEPLSEDDELTGGDMGKDMACEDILSALEAKDAKALRAALDDYFGSSK